MYNISSIKESRGPQLRISCMQGHCMTMT